MHKQQHCSCKDKKSPSKNWNAETKSDFRKLRPAKPNITRNENKNDNKQNCTQTPREEGVSLASRRTKHVAHIVDLFRHANTIREKALVLVRNLPANDDLPPSCKSR